MSSKRLASLVVFEKQGKILLIRRFNTGYEDGKYTLPSGKVDEGETFTQAAIRECFEEVNVKILNKNLKSAHIMYRKKNNEEYWVNHFFLCNKWSGEIKNKEPDKCDDVQWFDSNALPENTIPFVKYALEQIFAHTSTYSEYGWDENI